MFISDAVNELAVSVLVKDGSGFLLLFDGCYMIMAVGWYFFKVFFFN